MLVYKYRGGDKTIFNRDLKAIEKNIFWSPQYDKLNDPCECLINRDNFKSQSNLLGLLSGENKIKELLQRINGAIDNLFSVHKKYVGIYSLSKTFNDELLWAHYANSHTGFCIEYDFDKLLNRYDGYKVFSFPVIYTDSPPEFDFSDMNNQIEEKIRKIAGYKSTRWKYEQEFRLVTEVYGEYPYNHEALKAIYFGLRMNSSQKEEVMNRLKGRGIKYYEMIQLPNSYKFDRKLINDPYGEDITYFRSLPKSVANKQPTKFRILEKDYFRILKKATIKIELDSVISKPEIEWIANLIKTDLFHFADRIYMLFFVKDQKIKNVAWATSHSENNLIKVVINNFVEIH